MGIFGRVALRGGLILTPLLGFTWIFGVLSVNKSTIAFQYLFNIFNCLQGVAILICGILPNKEVNNVVNSISISIVSIKELFWYVIVSGLSQLCFVTYPTLLNQSWFMLNCCYRSRRHDRSSLPEEKLKQIQLQN